VAQPAKTHAPRLATECSAAEVIAAMRVEPRFPPAVNAVMSAEIAAGNFAN